MADPRHDLARITLAVLFIALLIGASLWILRPFLPAVVWAATLVIATWPIMLRLCMITRPPKGRRSIPPCQRTRAGERNQTSGPANPAFSTREVPRC